MSVLFVTTCSLTKAVGGTGAFDPETTVSGSAPRHAELLAARREEVRKLVKGGNAADWQGVPLKDLDYNRGLVKGVEFGGRKNAVYMPALDRYQGRFFQALGDAGKARCRSNDNLLIVSGLYGLLRVNEPVQLYSCPLSADIAAVWQRDSLLTDIVRAYVHRNGVLRVIDLTAMDAYRRLIDWDRVASERVEILHCFDSMAAGESALTSFGRLFRYLAFLGDDELIDLDPEHPPEEFGTCRLHRSSEPPLDYPVETWQSQHAAEVLGGGNPQTKPWQFTMTNRFKREARADFQAALRAVVDICNAPMSPHGDTVKPLSANNDRWWRYRLHKRRLVYEPDPIRRIVHFLRFEPRDRVYKDQ